MLSLSILYQLLKPDRPSTKKSDRTFLSNSIAHPQKTRRLKPKNPAVETQKTPAVETAATKTKPARQGLKIGLFLSRRPADIVCVGAVSNRRGFQIRSPESTQKPDRPSTQKSDRPFPKKSIARRRYGEETAVETASTRDFTRMAGGLKA
ncbi:MAG: hypothetical protein P2A85_18420 [Microcoleus anatoxicus]|uniref:hypothetical protein n=1 Tax=Microcoleus anatoxicus TaxID=2705319 RepID=UPI00366F1D9E